MLRDGCWLWLMVVVLSIAVPQSGCHPFLPWETTSGPACAGHGLGDFRWPADGLCAETWSDCCPGSPPRLLAQAPEGLAGQDAVSTGSVHSPERLMQPREQILLGALVQTSINSQLIEFCFSLFLDSIPLFYYTDNLTLYHRKILSPLGQKRMYSNTWL